MNVPRLRPFALSLGSLGVAPCVAWCGPIAFVGLIVPHSVRRLLGSSYRVVLPMSTAALGAPALVLLVARGRR